MGIKTIIPSNMKAFAILALLPLALALPAREKKQAGYGYAPAPYHPAPAYPAHHGYGYEQPKHNCSVIDVVEPAEVCTPVIVTECNDVELPIKIIVEIPFTYTVVRTVCTETIEVVPQEVCSFSYTTTEEETTAKTVEVTFEKKEDVQMVTVCQPGHHGYGGYGHGGYGHNYCKEVAQTTAYNVPVVTPIDVPVTVAYPTPVKTCVDKPIDLPVVTCADLSEERTIQVPSVEDSSVTTQKCVSALGAPACQAVELTLPKQVCKELNYGHAHETADYAPAPAPAYAPAA